MPQLVALVICLQACNVLDVAGRPAQEAARLTVLLGDAARNEVADTVLPLAVRVQARGGDPAVGASVRFDLTEAAASLGLRLLTAPGDSERATLSVVTRADGLAVVQVHFGFLAGRCVVRIAVPSLALEDSAVYQLQGSPQVVVMSLRDTAVSTGDTFRIVARGIDGFSRPTFTALTFEASDPSRATVTAAGLVRAEAVGRAHIRIRGAQRLDSVGVSVVPSGTLAAMAGTSLVLVRLDGTGYRTVKRFVEEGAYQRQRWAPSGDRLVYEFAADGSHSRLYTVGLDGISQRLFTTGALHSEIVATYSPDGGWVYFAGQPNLSYGNTEIWRVRTDGSGAERVGPPSVPNSSTAPTLSPDGSRVAMVSSSTIQVLDLATRSVTDLGIQGAAPRWSPTGTLIGYVDGGVVKLVRPDGTGLRALTDTTRRYGEWLDWSPDGQWLVARSGTVDLLRASTGERLPLPFTRTLAWPTYQP
jgi:hypothetical protein